MLQTTLSVPIEVRPESASQLAKLIEEFKQREDKIDGEGVDNFANILNGLPNLHFMSISLFEDVSYDPIFIVEVNIDGAAPPFWFRLETVAGQAIRQMLRCCKRPQGRRGRLYDGVISDSDAQPLGPFMDAMAQPPSVFHHGNRGLSRKRILREAALFRNLRETLDGPQGVACRAMAPALLHASLRKMMLERFDWLADRPEPRITHLERAVDVVRLALFALLVLLVLSAPGIVSAALLSWSAHLAACLLIGAFLALILWRRDKAILSQISLGALSLRTVTLLAGGALLLLALLYGVGLIVGAGAGLAFNAAEAPNWGRALGKTLLSGQLGLLVTVPGLVLWLRALERRDSSHLMPPIDEAKVAQMLQREDWIAQNHMASVVHIRPGVLRALIIRAGHRGLGLLLRVKATDGYLGSMRTVHFAHWAFLNNGSRLLFVSNFDQSWGSYLDDFIEKAAVGLTLAWGCGVGFPPTDFLITGGAARGRLFKNWALASRSVSRFWCSAYPDLSVDQIERNHRVVQGLRKDRLADEQLASWMREL